MINLCHFTESLSKEKWICFQGENDKYSVSEVVGIRDYDFSQTHNYVIRKFLKLLPIDFGIKKDLVEAVGLIHLDAHSIENFKKLLQLIYKKYKVEIPPGKEFVDFYNRILSKLVDFFYINNQSENIKLLANEFFLSINDISKKKEWLNANKIFYIDDKPNYDILPTQIKEKVQPHFTNRDKNTFGKIAGKIGKRFSNSIQKELIESEAINTVTLVSFFKFLPESIALLESRLDTVLNEYLEKLKSIRVYENEVLKVKISVGNSDELTIPVNHFVDVDKNFSFHFSIANNPNKNKQISESISELFINLLGRDLKQFNSDLYRFLNSTDKKEYLKDYDILEERINEIRDKLNSFDLTSNQKFWEAILSAKFIEQSDNVFIGNEVNKDSLAETLRIENSLIQKIQEKFDFQQTNNPENISLLKELLSSLFISLEDLNKNIFPKIDFRDFYEKKLEKLKNSFEKGFDSILHNHLTKQPSEEKSLYQDHLDNYKRYLQFPIPLNTLELSIDDYFVETLKKDFSLIEISMADLQKDYSSFNPISIYTENFSLLKNKLKKEEFTNDNLDAFFAENKRRSLLYFNETNLLADSFKKWLGDFKEKNKPIENESDILDFLSEYSNQTTTDIEEVTTQEVDVSTTNGTRTNKGGGKRFDGGANDQNKIMLGLVAEMVVYEKLKIIYENVTWVSKFASKIPKTHQGYNPEGQDGLGYDIEYIDNDGNKIFVEVKGRSDNSDSFEITNNEIDKAHQEQQNYKIFFVTQTLDNTKRRIRDLGNIFILEYGEDFFSNRKFKAVYRNFEIRFKETE